MELKSSIDEMKNALESIVNRVDHMEERINELEDRNMEMIQVEEERELSFFLNEKILWELCDSLRKGNIRITGIPAGEEREKEAESLFKEITAENFPNLRKELDYTSPWSWEHLITSVQKDLLQDT